MSHVTQVHESCYTYECVTNSYTITQGTHGGVAGGGA